MKKQIIYGLLVSVLLAFCLYVTPSANAASAEEEIIQAVTNFAKAMNNAEFDLMSSLYWHSPKVSMFGPPKSMAFLIQGWEGVEAVWKGNLIDYPKGTFNINFHNLQVTMLEDNIAVLTGYSILTVNPPASKEQFSEQERVTCVVQKIGGKWLLVHQHVSILPTE